jgi:integrin-linked kinase-associated serine/threonine phosphatase 2C
MVTRIYSRMPLCFVLFGMVVAMQVPLCALPTRGKTSAPSTRQAARRSAEYERLSLMLEEYNPSLHQQFVMHAGRVMTRTGLKSPDKKALQSFLKAVAVDADVHPADKKAIQQFFKSGLSTGAKIGIGVGSAVALAALAVIAARNGISRGMRGALGAVGRAPVGPSSHANVNDLAAAGGGAGSGGARSVMAGAQSPHTPAGQSSHAKANDLAAAGGGQIIDFVETCAGAGSGGASSLMAGVGAGSGGGAGDATTAGGGSGGPGWAPAVTSSTLLNSSTRGAGNDDFDFFLTTMKSVPSGGVVASVGGAGGPGLMAGNGIPQVLAMCLSKHKKVCDFILRPKVAVSRKLNASFLRVITSIFAHTDLLPTDQLFCIFYPVSKFDESFLMYRERAGSLASLSVFGNQDQSFDFAGVVSPEDSAYFKQKNLTKITVQQLRDFIQSIAQYVPQEPEASSSKSLSMYINRLANELYTPIYSYDSNLTRDLWDLSRSSLAIGVSQIRGARSYMEDAVSVDETDSVTVVSVFDGHGGHIIARELRDKFTPSLKRSSSYDDDGIKKFFIDFDQELKREWSHVDAGSTATIGMFLPSGDIKLVNLGDSRIVVCDEFGHEVVSTQDHTPSNASEKLRIASERRPGEITGDNRVKIPSGDLEVSRAFGDYEYKNYNDAISNVPDVITLSAEQRAQARYMILASDGLWVRMKNNEVAEFVVCNVRNGLSMKAVANGLVMEAYRKGSGDNISVVVIDLRHMRRDIAHTVESSGIAGTGGEAGAGAGSGFRADLADAQLSVGGAFALRDTSSYAGASPVSTLSALPNSSTRGADGEDFDFIAQGFDHKIGGIGVTRKRDDLVAGASTGGGAPAGAGSGSGSPGDPTTAVSGNVVAAGAGAGSGAGVSLMYAGAGRTVGQVPKIRVDDEGIIALHGESLAQAIRQRFPLSHRFFLHPAFKYIQVDVLESPGHTDNSSLLMFYHSLSDTVLNPGSELIFVLQKISERSGQYKITFNCYLEENNNFYTLCMPNYGSIITKGVTVSDSNLIDRLRTQLSNQIYRVNSTELNDLCNLLKKSEVFKSNLDLILLKNRSRRSFLSLHEWYDGPQFTGVGISEMIGERPTMEDAVAVSFDDRLHAVAVFDGHGGAEMAERCRDGLLNKLSGLGEYIVDDEAIKRAFYDFDEMLRHQNHSESSSTATLALMLPSGTLKLVNLGDSRSIILSNAGTVLSMTVDHTPRVADERDRILGCGGIVSEEGKIEGNLDVSRGFGDYRYKTPSATQDEKGRNIYKVSNIPDIITVGPKVMADARFVVLASNGLWGKMTNEQVAEFVLTNQALSSYQIARELALKAYGSRSQDNISVVVVDLHVLRSGEASAMTEGVAGAGSGVGAPAGAGAGSGSGGSGDTLTAGGGSGGPGWVDSVKTGALAGAGSGDAALSDDEQLAQRLGLPLNQEAFEEWAQKYASSAGVNYFFEYRGVEFFKRASSTKPGAFYIFQYDHPQQGTLPLVARMDKVPWSWNTQNLQRLQRLPTFVNDPQY